ncbi:25 kDa protein elicitor [Pleomassaria siparia CBS 279.74]|uniref:25 kDa protein elicitor n=1 Tax=Pleomassaria siparia CBS 279.74 TaxID=1314801 RepID=A0A6G1KHB1_9PLEO|nr:25 kDa protein elicitor [Pleomassaria siparia CBS 279.74]
MLFNIQNLVLGLAVASTSVSAAPLLKSRAVIDHDAVVGFPEAVPDGLEGELMLRYKPFLKVVNGCVPFPVVNANGDTGGGLKPTGSAESGCSSSPGQIYARAANYNGLYAIMYSWYMPKDSPSDGLGHRHDWENAIVWLSDLSEDAELRGVAISAHGDYDKLTEPHLSGDRPRIGYKSSWPVDHQLIDETEEGGEQPLVSWQCMTEEARVAISTTDFGSARTSLSDANFEYYLEKGQI